MNLLTGFSDSPNQSTVITLDDGSSATIVLYFRAQQKGWFYDLIYGEFSLLGQRLVCGENIIRQFRDQVPFGLAVLSESRRDPSKITSLSSRETVIILLNSEDVNLIEFAQFTRDD